MKEAYTRLLTHMWSFMCRETIQSPGSDGDGQANIHTSMPANTSGTSQEQAKAWKVCSIDSEDERAERSSGPWGDGVRDQQDERRDAMRHRDCPNASRRVASRGTDQEGDGVRH